MRLLMIYADENGTAKSLMLDGVDDDGFQDGTLDMPSLMEHADDCNPASNVCFVEMPDSEFRPSVYDDQGDEIAMSFTHT